MTCYSFGNSLYFDIFDKFDIADYLANFIKLYNFMPIFRICSSFDNSYYFEFWLVSIWIAFGLLGNFWQFCIFSTFSSSSFLQLFYMFYNLDNFWKISFFLIIFENITIFDKLEKITTLDNVDKLLTYFCFKNYNITRS